MENIYELLNKLNIDFSEIEEIEVSELEKKKLKKKLIESIKKDKNKKK